MAAWLGQGRTALVTGGSSGIGLAIAGELVRAGMDVILLARRPEPLREAQTRLSSGPGKVSTFAADVSSIHSLRMAEQALRTTHPQIDLLVNCAGIVKPGLLADLGDSDISSQISVDLLGPIQATRVFMGAIPAGGAIINISSAAGIIGLAGESVYSAAKAGIICFSEALRRELLPRRISVHVVLPADVDTPQYRAERDEMPAWMKEGGKPKAMKPEAVARAVLRGARRRRFIITPSGMTTFFHFMTGHFPALSRFLIDLIAGRPRPER